MKAYDLLDRSAWEIGSPLHNKLAEGDRPVHAWYRFVLSYPPHLVREYLSKFGVSAGDVVLDPFCGTGTTLVECKKLGIGSVGYEANDMAALATRVKTDWNVPAFEFARVARWAAEKAQAEIEETLRETPPLTGGRVQEQLDIYGPIQEGLVN